MGGLANFIWDRMRAAHVCFGIGFAALCIYMCAIPKDVSAHVPLMGGFLSGELAKTTFVMVLNYCQMAN